MTIDNKTLKESLKTSLARDSIISNNDSDDNKSNAADTCFPGKLCTSVER